MDEVILQLSISADEYQKVYRGDAHQVSAVAIDGRRIRFPVNILQKFITHQGVQGCFALTFDDQHRFKEIRRIE